MPLQTFDELFAAADGRTEPVAVAAIGGEEPTVLEALAEARRRGWVSPVVTGNENAIRDAAETVGVDLDGFRIVASDEPARAAVDEVNAGRAAMLMKGRVDTPAMMKAVLDREAGLRTGKTICQVVLMECGAKSEGGSRRSSAVGSPPESRNSELGTRDSKPFLLSDTGITIAPNLTKKFEIVEHVAGIARALGSAEPKIALIAATEKVTETMPDTLHAAELARRNRDDGAFPGCVVEGPLSIDLAFADDAGTKKSIAGRVVGAAEGTVYPNLQTANITVKALMYLADSRFGGVLCGVACPVVFMSRSDTTETRLNSLALAIASCPT